MTALLALVPRWLLLAAAAALLALTGLQTVRLSASQGDAATARIESASLRVAMAEANTQAALQSAALSNQILKAQNEAKIREAGLQLAAVAATTESDGLRDDLAVVRDQLSQLSHNAVVERAAAVSNVLTDCTAKYQGMADKAGKHASDVRTLIEAWPRASALAP